VTSDARTGERPAGLSAAEAAARLAAEGPNELRVDRAPGWPAALLGQLRDTMILVLLVAAALTAAVGDLPDMVVILAVVVVNSALGALQEVRSGQALASLAELTAPRATVIRDGRRLDVPAREVVRGDLLGLVAGDIVAADATVSTARSLLLDESVLTGESVPAGRLPGERLHAGTVVTRGRAEAVVDAVGQATAVGGIARSLRDTRTVLSPLQRQLGALGRWLAVAVTVAAVAVAVLQLALGHSLENSVVIGISLAVAAIPESLPAVVSLSLALAARRMTARGVLVRRLACVETLGSITVLAADKTGTLTEGRMVLGDRWEPADRPALPVGLLAAAALCNDAAAGHDAAAGNGAAVTGGAQTANAHDDPTEVALVAAATAAGIDVPELRAAYPRIAEEPFDPATARMTTSHRMPGGGTLTVVKGAPEVVAGTGSGPGIGIGNDNGTGTGNGEQQAAADRLGAAGARVLAVAADAGAGRQLLGLLALTDPPRPRAGQLIAAFRAAGVRPVMITGDHPGTARAVAGAVGIDTVYARVRPAGKTGIVTGLQAAGEVVAMTGDGVNDAPALRAADIGIAMGRHGTEVAKQAADMVLTGDDLAGMIPAIGEGRRAYDNLRRFLHYAVSGGLAEVLIMLLGPFFGFGVPLRAGQILWVNLLTHGLPGVAMGNEPAEPDVLVRPPRPPAEQLLDRRTRGRIAVLATAITIASLLAGGWARHADRPWQSVIFLTLTLCQLGVALALRPRHSRPASNPGLLVAVAVNVLLALLALWWPPLRELLRTEPLTAADLVPCLLAAAGVAVVARLQTRPTRRT